MKDNDHHLCRGHLVTGEKVIYEGTELLARPYASATADLRSEILAPTIGEQPSPIEEGRYGARPLLRRFPKSQVHASYASQFDRSSLEFMRRNPLWLAHVTDNIQEHRRT